MDISSLKYFEEETWVDNLTILAALILPGFCYFYFVKPTFFEEISFSKLIVLSFFYSTIPFLIAYFFSLSSDMHKELKKIKKERDKKIEELTKMKVQYSGIAPTDLIKFIDKTISQYENSPSIRYHLQSISAFGTIISTFFTLAVCFLLDKFDSVLKIYNLEISIYFALLLFIVIGSGFGLILERLSKRKK